MTETEVSALLADYEAAFEEQDEAKRLACITLLALAVPRLAYEVRRLRQWGIVPTGQPLPDAPTLAGHEA